MAAEMAGVFLPLRFKHLNCLSYLPPMLALNATPTPHTRLFAIAATSPAHRVPCLLSPLSRGIGSSSLSFISVDARGSYNQQQLENYLPRGAPITHSLTYLMPENSNSSTSKKLHSLNSSVLLIFFSV